MILRTGYWKRLVSKSGKFVAGGNGVRNHFMIGEGAIELGYGQSAASGCGRHDLSCPEPGELSVSSFQKRRRGKGT